MCGIAGYFAKNLDNSYIGFLEKAIRTLSKRGPDLQKCVQLSKNVGMAHARLSILDVSDAGNQPMTDESGRFTIIFNGEIFNFKELKKRFLGDVILRSGSDTEVLLYLFKLMGKDCLKHINGFFAFAIFDKHSDSIFLARDRFGIKPLHLYTDENLVIFGSEIKALLRFPIKKEINYDSLNLYLQLNYLPPGSSMLHNFQKLLPGHFATIDATGVVVIDRYYSIPFETGTVISARGLDYDAAKNKLKQVVQDAVERRLVSDVPLGSFLSGGVDSSIISACAVKHVPHLNTFSLGYSDDPFFDETKYANKVAQKLKTEHTVFAVTNDEMFENIFSVLDYIDEPFADSSAIAVFLLSKKTRSRVTVALSGDGGDELFAGYNKHAAELNARNETVLNKVLKASLPVLKMLPKSRQSAAGNLFRQAQRYSEGLYLSRNERYWKWCSLTNKGKVLQLLVDHRQFSEAERLEKNIEKMITAKGDLNDILFADMNLVLPGDMLTKVDLMSMANSLEIRVPLLDYNVVNYAFSLPSQFKIGKGETKKILKDAFRKMLPEEIFTRRKHGFEVPLLRWLQTGLRSLIEEDLLQPQFIVEQKIFDPVAVESLKAKLFSNNPEDSHATVWALVVFQYWYKKFLLADA